MSFSADRVERIACAAKEAGAAGAYIRETANIEWATAFEDVFDDEQAHGLMVFGDGAEGACAPVVHTDSRYSTAMEREAEGTPFQIDASQKTMAAWAAELWGEAIGGGSEAASVARLAIEDSISLHEYRALQKTFAEACDAAQGDPFIETTDLVLKLRAVKDAHELELMSEAQAVTDAALDHILGFIAPGKTEREIQLELDDFMMRHGADSLAFPSIVASGANGASPHAIVSDKPVQTGECIVMDFGARRRDYCSDMTRTIFVGKPEGEMLRAWETLRRANETVEQKLHCGMTGREAHELALLVLADGGFEGRMGHSLGHGVGIQIHELPVLSPRNDKPLVEGNVVTVEPGIYIPGKFGMRLEDCGVMTSRGYERFTQSTHEMIVV